MGGSMIVATENFVKKHPDHKGSIAFLITADEEGPAKNGTVKVVETLEARNEKIDMCIVGEPSSTNQTGDVVKNGRRGSLGCVLKVKGIQGHVAYPHLAKNPVHIAAPALAELAADILKQRTQAILDKHGLEYDIDWNLSGEPFLTSRGALVDASVQAIREVTGLETELSTAGGTSDGRFIAPTGSQVLELGPCNATIHKVDEHVTAADLDILTTIYERILELLLA